jgi:hypothetical protein
MGSESSLLSERRTNGMCQDFLTVVMHGVRFGFTINNHLNIDCDGCLIKKSKKYRFGK